MQISTRRQLPKILPILNGFRRQESAAAEMDLLKDLLIWSDEYTPNPADRDDDLVLDLLTWLWQYRMIQLTGRAPLHAGWYEQARSLWETCLQDAPLWAGFSPERCNPSEEINTQIRALRKAGNRTVVDFLRRWRDRSP